MLFIYSHWRSALLPNFLLVNYLCLTASYCACRDEVELAHPADQPPPDDDEAVSMDIELR